MEEKISLIDKEREAEKRRKSATKFKKQRNQNSVKKKARNKSDNKKEDVTYQSGVALAMDPEILDKAKVTKEQLQEFEKEVPAFTIRPRKKFITCDDQDSCQKILMISFDTETSCGGKEAEIIQLAAESQNGKKFSRFILPEREISYHASRVNKFQITSIGGKRILHRGGAPLETVSQTKCLESFVNFLADCKKSHPDCDKVVLIGHNSATFDTPVILRTIIHSSPQLIMKMKDLNVHFADSLGLIRRLIQEKCQALKTKDRSNTKANQAAVYKQLFKAEFPGHDAAEDVKALNKILLDSPLGVNTCQIVNKSNTTMIESAIEDLVYMDQTYSLQQSLIENLCNSSSNSSDSGVISKALAKKLAESGIGYQHLRRVFEKHGERGLLAILANPPTNRPTSRRGPTTQHHAHGSTDRVVLNQILSHFKGLPD